jgi:hypothetical protein
MMFFQSLFFTKTVKDTDTLTLTFNVDCEWQGKKFLSLQLLIQTGVSKDVLLLYYNSEFEPLFNSNVEQYLLHYKERMKNDLTPIFIPWDNKKSETTIFDDAVLKTSKILNVNVEQIKRVQVNFFYSLRDLYYLFSETISSSSFFG